MSDLNSIAILGAAAEAGGYFSIFKIVFTIAITVPWLWTASWINKDAVRVHTHQLLWSGLILAAGAVSLLILFLLPWYAVGLLVYIAMTCTVAGVYVAHRNKRVVQSAKVLTSEHLRSVFASAAKPKQIEAVQHIKLYDSRGRAVFAPPVEEPEKRQAYNLAQNFLNEVILFRASEVDLTPAGAQVAVRYVVDGVLQQRPTADRNEAEAVIDYVKGLAGIDVEEKRLPQTGKIGAEAGAVTIDMDVTTAGTTRGQRLQLRIVQEAARTNLVELGLPKDLLVRMEELNDRTGLIIVSGQKSSGVTSTLYSLLRRRDAFIHQLVAIELRGGVDLENITQQRCKDPADLAAKLASLLRRDPDVVMVDSCGTEQTADLICQAAVEKSLLLGCNADSALTALAKWIKVAGDAGKAVAPLKAVTCQLLLRKLCPKCREAYRPPRDMLAKLNLPAEKIERFYRPPTKPLTDEKGNPVTCPVCRGTGYYGRTGAFELLEMTDEIRDLVIQGASLGRIKAACRKNKMLYLQEQALRKVIEGATSIDEVIRVCKKKR